MHPTLSSLGRNARRRAGQAGRAALVAAALAVAAGGVAAATSPTAVMGRGDSFVEFTGTGPIGNNEVGQNDTLFWFHESTGVYDGKAVDSWFVFFDPAANNGVRGTVSFAAPVLYTFTNVNDLIKTASFGDPGVKYNYASMNAGLEGSDLSHTVVDGNDISLRWRERPSNPGDYMRVLTAASAVPEPGTWALLLAGLATIGVISRRRLRD